MDNPLGFKLPKTDICGCPTPHPHSECLADGLRGLHPYPALFNPTPAAAPATAAPGPPKIRQYFSIFQKIIYRFYNRISNPTIRFTKNGIITLPEPSSNLFCFLTYLNLFRGRYLYIYILCYDIFF